MSNVTVQPTSVRTRMPNRDATENNWQARNIHVAYMCGHNLAPICKGNLQWAIGGAFIASHLSPR